MRVFLLIIAILFVGNKWMFSQQIPVFSMMNTDEFIYNPAYAGANPYLTAHAKQRLQYLGVDYAPNTQMISVESSISGRNFGIGGYFINETNGVLGKMQGMATYAYHIPLADETSLSFGVSVGIHQLRTIAGRMILHNMDDNLLNTQTNQRKSFFNSNAGMLLHGEMYYVGYSLLNTFNTDYSIYSGSQLDQQFHHHMHYGLKFYSGTDGLITLSGRHVLTKGLPAWHQFGVLYDYNERFFGGLQFRWGDAIIGMVGAKIWDELRFYYAYDFGVGGYRSANSGSHELSLIYQFHYDPIYSKDKKRYSNKVHRGWKISFKKKPKLVMPEELPDSP
ncbi:MAG: type IX secretion system membrane protein PorP/SprF [Flavobacteriales bacterium]|nr:type IX secretion system membrane protein PorP/SprF [Flavobacteriales bacterium]